MSGKSSHWRKAHSYFQKAKGLKKKPFLDDFCFFLLAYSKQLNQPKNLIKSLPYFSNPKHFVLLYQAHYEMTLNASSLVNCAFYLQKSKKEPQTYLIWARFLKIEGLLTNTPEGLLEGLEKIDLALMIKPKLEFYQESILIACYYTLMTDHFKGIVIARKHRKLLKTVTANEEDFYSTFLQLTEGSYFQEPNKISNAIEKLESFLQKNPTNPSIWQALAIGYFEKYHLSNELNYLEKAHFCFEKYYALKPYCLRAQMDLAVSSQLLAEETQSKTLLEKSLIFYEDTLNNASNLNQLNPQMLFHYANALDLYGDFTQNQLYYLRASLLFGKSLEVDPENQMFRLAFAKTLCHIGELTNRVSWFKQATAQFQLILRQDPENEFMLIDYASALMNLACLTEEKWSLHLANRLLKKSLLLGNDKAWYYLACNQALLGELDLAWNCLKKTKELNMLPSIEQMNEDRWLDNVRETRGFKKL